MTPAHAATAGALTGLLLGSAICLIQNIPVVESLFRISILAFAGAWMGILLAWLNQILPDKKNQHDQQDGHHLDTRL
ncbi:hypothetical protein MMIC_P0357 [Mariprofundus micogutta]|uniref:Uncharacterized protein n=1 Tax=Mariprofundus micogutta TaxID=1921010 RepID=A0A1L8CKI7_9PROT|nr:hypothetical protein [Mariprofundus micogutta]GAV19423.1 hypothetical protein MMIC_P0357 [Mariprofundus micogutta]